MPDQISLLPSDSGHSLFLSLPAPTDRE